MASSVIKIINFSSVLHRNYILLYEYKNITIYFKSGEISMCKKTFACDNPHQVYPLRFAESVWKPSLDGTLIISFLSYMSRGGGGIFYIYIVPSWMFPLLWSGTQSVGILRCSLEVWWEQIIWPIQIPQARDDLRKSQSESRFSRIAIQYDDVQMDSIFVLVLVWRYSGDLA